MGAAVHYTTNGDTPTGSSITVPNPITVSVDTLLKAIGLKSGLTDSTIKSANYSILNNPTLLGGFSIDSPNTNVSGGTESSGRDFINKEDTLDSGTVRIADVSFYTNPPTNKTVRIKVWRQNGANLVLVGTSEPVNVGNIVNNGNPAVVISNTIPCQVGDYAGIWIEGGLTSTERVVLDITTRAVQQSTGVAIIPISQRR